MELALVLVGVFVARFLVSFLSDAQTIYILARRTKPASLLAGLEELLTWATIGFVVHSEQWGCLQRSRCNARIC